MTLEISPVLGVGHGIACHPEGIDANTRFGVPGVTQAVTRWAFGFAEGELARRYHHHRRQLHHAATPPVISTARRSSSLRRIATRNRTVWMASSREIGHTPPRLMQASKHLISSI